MKKMIKGLMVGLLTVSMLFTNTISVFAEEPIATDSGTVSVQYEDGRDIKTLDIVDGKVKAPGEYGLNLEKREDTKFAGWTLNDETELIHSYSYVSVKDGDILKTHYVTKLSDFRVKTKGFKTSGTTLTGGPNDINVKGKHSGEFRDEVTRDFKQLYSGKYTLAVEGLDPGLESAYSVYENTGSLKVSNERYEDGKYLFDLDFKAADTGSMLSMDIKFTKNVVTLNNDDGSFIKEMNIENDKVTLPYDFNLDLKKEGYTFNGWILNDDDSKLYRGYEVVTVKSGDVFTAVWKQSVNDLQIFDNTNNVTGINIKGTNFDADATISNSFPGSKRWDVKGITKGNYTITVSGLNENDVIKLKQRASYGDMTFNSIEYVDGVHIIDADFVPEKGGGVFLSMELDVIPTVRLNNDDNSFIQTMEIVNGKVRLPYDWSIGLEKTDHNFVGWTLNDNTSKVYNGSTELDVNNGDVFTSVWKERVNDLQVFDRSDKITEITIKGNGLDLKGTSSVSGPSYKRWDFTGIKRGEYTMTLKGLDGKSNLDLSQRASYGDMTFKSVDYVDGDYIIIVEFVPEKGYGVFLSMDIEEVPKQFVDFVYEDGSVIETKEIKDGKVFVPYSWNFDFKDIEDKHFDGWLLNDGTEYISENKELDVEDGDILTAVFVNNTNDLQFDVPRTVANVHLKNEDGTVDLDMYSDTSFPDSKRYKLNDLASGKYTFTVAGLDPNSVITPEQSGGSSDASVVSEGFVDDLYVIVLDIKMTENTYDFLRYELTSLAKLDVNFDLGKHGTSSDDLDYVVVEHESVTNVPNVTVKDGYKFLGFTIDGSTIINPLETVIESDTTFIALYEAGVGTFSMNDDTKLITKIRLINKDTSEELELIKTEEDNYNTWSHDGVASGDYIVEFYGLAEDAIIDFAHDANAPTTRALKTSPSNVKEMSIVMDPNNPNAASSQTFSVSYMVFFDIGTNGTSKDALEMKVKHGSKVTSLPTVVPQDGFKQTGWTLAGKVINPEEVKVESTLNFSAAYEEVKVDSPILPNAKEDKKSETPKTDVSSTYFIYVLLIAAASMFIGFLNRKTKQQ